MSAFSGDDREWARSQKTPGVWRGVDKYRRPATPPAETPWWWLVPYVEQCGHTVAFEQGEEQHHQIPDDGAPHAPTSECGCCPQRHLIDGHVVYEHFDQGALD